MKITRRQLRKIIKEVSSVAANDEGIGDKAIRNWLLDELLVDPKGLTLEDVLQQSEGAGFESEITESAIEEMIAAKEIIEKDGKLVVP